MNTKWYVEAFDLYDTHNGGFANISEPFDDAAEARAFAEASDKGSIALYKVENNVFEHVDDYTGAHDDVRPQGWHADVSEVEVEAYQQRLRDEFKAEQDALEQSGKAVAFWVIHNGFWHRPYADRASAEKVVAKIKELRPWTNADVYVMPPGGYPGRIFPVEGVDE